LSSLEEEYKSEIKDILTGYEQRQKRRQAKVGTVVSVKCAKSITVQYVYPKFYPKYNKWVNRRRKLMAHDEEERCGLGDVVRIVPCRPMSKMKRHAIIDIIRKPKLSHEEDARLRKIISQGEAVSNKAKKAEVK
jgi:small subunit ribosomal protein S17